MSSREKCSFLSCSSGLPGRYTSEFGETEDWLFSHSKVGAPNGDEALVMAATQEQFCLRTGKKEEAVTTEVTGTRSDL